MFRNFCLHRYKPIYKKIVNKYINNKVIKIVFLVETDYDICIKCKSIRFTYYCELPYKDKFDKKRNNLLLKLLKKKLGKFIITDYDTFSNLALFGTTELPVWKS